MAGNRVFWACNGQEIRDVHYTEWSVGDKGRLKRASQDRPIRIQLVRAPPGRCPHCGEKIHEKKETNPPTIRTERAG